MGSEDLHKKRKENDNLGRKQANRPVKKRVLIVCEDSTCTPAYLNAIKTEYPNLVIEIPKRPSSRQGESEPKKIKKHAIEEINKSFREGNGFDAAFLVFDRDNHDTYDEVMAWATHEPSKKRICGHTLVACFPSVPCFEYWVLLHFEDTAGHFEDYAALKTALKKHIPDYDKGNMERIYQKYLKNRTDDAKQRASKIARQAKLEGETYSHNPVTYLHTLFAELKTMHNAQCILKNRLR